MKSTTIPLAVPDDLAEEVRETARRTQLSQADVMRQSMKLGLPRVREQFSVNQPLVNVRRLPAKVLERIYREREEDEETIRAFVAAQPKGTE